MPAFVRIMACAWRLQGVALHSRRRTACSRIAVELGEIRAGIAKLYRNGAPDELKKAKIYENWLDDELLETYGNRIVEFDEQSAQLWGMLLSDQKKDPHTIDKQIAAMALTRDMIVVTRDKGEAFLRIPKLKMLNPFSDAAVSKI